MQNNRGKVYFGNNILASPRKQDSVEWNLSNKRLVSLLDMLRFYAENFIAVLTILTKFEGAMAVFSQNEHIWQPNTCSLIEDFGELGVICTELGLIRSARNAYRMQNYLIQHQSKNSFIKENISNLTTSLYDDLSLSVCLILSKESAIEYFDKPNLFGNEVADRFPSANFDIEEAGKCFATARYTACVMHLQRVIEVSLKSYGNFLGIMTLIATAQPSWNKVLDQTRKEIKERSDRNFTAKSWRSDAEKQFCEDIQPFLEAVKVAWRNPSMHVDKTYTEDIAKEIFDAVKTFMRNIAEHLNEKGKFRIGKKR